MMRAAAIIVALSSLLPAAAATDPAPISLGMIAVGQETDYFEVSVAPGGTADLSVQLLNAGSTDVEARAYVAGVYTVANGGLGVDLSDALASGTATWVDYPTTLEMLQAGVAMTKDFRVSVPAGTAPGEYIASLVLENATPIDGAAGLGQVIRTALAVSIRVPGQLRPGLEIGAAHYAATGGQSMLAIEIDNAGNARLEPTLVVTVRDTVGAVVVQRELQLGSVYAGTHTTAELSLPALLSPGSYTVDVAAADEPRGLSPVAADDLPFVVSAQRWHERAGGRLP